MTYQSRHQATWKTRIKVLVAMIPLLICVTPVAASQTISELPDPTRPLYSARASSGTINHSLVLQSILHSDHQRNAVINGQVANIGSYINGKRIVDIKYDAVVIKHNGQLYTLYLSNTKSVTQREAQ
jgi:hypothetical protein